MMGRQTGDQSQLFYLFNLERRIPVGNLLRRINPVVTRILAELRDKLAAFYSDSVALSHPVILPTTSPSCRRHPALYMKASHAALNCGRHCTWRHCHDDAAERIKSAVRARTLRRKLRHMIYNLGS